MIKNFDNMQELGKNNLDATLKSLSALSRNVQVITAEMANYSKQSIEDSTKAMDKLLSSNIIEKAVEIQTDFAMAACESFLAGAAKMSGLYATLAMETYRPFEGNLSKVVSINKAA